MKKLIIILFFICFVFIMGCSEQPVIYFNEINEISEIKKFESLEILHYTQLIRKRWLVRVVIDTHPESHGLNNTHLFHIESYNYNLQQALTDAIKKAERVSNALVKEND